MTSTDHVAPQRSTGEAPEHTHYDAIVVGARVAGAATAMLLAQQGWRVLVLDRGTRGSDTRSTHALMKAGVYLLERWGVRDTLVERGAPPVMSTTFHYGDESVRIPFEPTTDVSSLLAPRRTVLDPALVEAAEAMGAEIHHGTPVSVVVRGADGRVAGVRGRGADGTLFDVRAPIVIGADGVSSLIARRVGAPVTVQADHAAAFVYAYFGPGDGPPTDTGFDGYEWCYRPRGSAGVMPTNGGVIAWVGMPPDRFESRVRHRVEGEFWHELHATGPEVYGRITALERTSRFHASAGLAGYLRRCAGPGWALVGDASHYTDPASAHGITDALRDAHLLATAVDAGLSDASTMDDALAGYERTRDQLSLPLLRATDRLASFDWSMAELRIVLREMSDAMKRELAFLRHELAPAAGQAA